MNTGNKNACLQEAGWFSINLMTQMLSVSSGSTTDKQIPPTVISVSALAPETVEVDDSVYLS